MTVSVIRWIIFSYLLGSIPSGYVISRIAKGIDIREHGSGNPGAANVYRTVGAWAGWLTFLFDAAKGYLSIYFVLRRHPDDYYLAIICGALAIAGHMWTIFLKFKGGKGVATSAGVFASLMPVPTLAAFCAFVIFVALTKHISAGTLAASAVFPVSSVILPGTPKQYVFLGIAVSAAVVYKHIPNIKRLMGRKELAFKDGGKKTKDDKN